MPETQTAEVSDKKINDKTDELLEQKRLQEFLAKFQDDVRGALKIDAKSGTIESEIFRKANAGTIDEMVTVVNGGKPIFSALQTFFKILISLPIWATIVGLFSLLKVNLIKRNEIGVTEHNGKVEILEPGYHYLLSPTHNLITKMPVNAEFFNHDSFTKVTIPKGKFGWATYNGATVILGPGVHAYNDPLFKMALNPRDRTPLIENINPNPSISLNGVTIARVNEGQIGKAWYNGKPVFLQPGLYAYDDANFKFDGVANLNDELISHGYIHILRVPKGRKGLYYDEKGAAHLADPGLHLFETPGYRIEKFDDRYTVDATQKITEIGPFTKVYIEDGEVGIVSEDGPLKFKEPGQYTFEAPRQRFKSVFSTKEEVQALAEIDVFSNDTVQVKVQSNIMWQVDKSDPDNIRKAVTEVDGVNEAIKKYAESTLAEIILSTDINKAGGPIPANVKAPELDDDQVQKISEHVTSNEVHDRFKAKLAGHLLTKWGVTLHDIRIENIKIVDEHLLREMGEQVVAKNRQAAKNAIAKSAAEVMRIETEAEVNKISQLADAEADKITKLAKAGAEKVTIDADAYAKAVKIKAEGDVKAVEIISTDKSGLAAEMALTKARGAALGESGATIVAAPKDVSTWLTCAKMGVNFFPVCRGEVEREGYEPEVALPLVHGC